MITVCRALEAARLRRENAVLREKEEGVADLVGESAAMVQLRGQNSKRADGPFVVVSAATMEPEHLEEKLFGREREGGLAVPGLFEAAHGGTLFFDEVADMPKETQSKILRVLIDQAFTRVGGSDTVRVDVRIVSATSRDLAEEIAVGAFREDLYHRLNVVPVDAPTLGHRREDIRLLVDHLARECPATQEYRRADHDSWRWNL